MKTNILNFVITLIIALLLSPYLPWWSVMVAGFVSALFFSLKKASVFFVPFLAVFLFFVLYSYMLSSVNNFILAKKIAILLPLGGDPFVLILVTGLIGGLATGVAAMFGKQLSNLVKK